MGIEVFFNCYNYIKRGSVFILLQLTQRSLKNSKSYLQTLFDLSCLFF
ncbi:hypothetical protein C1A50_4584 [Paenibacillus polymyxa]|nr:hypothetical protein C1A50_4584 [Paenibacillus polymyxa]